MPNTAELYIRLAHALEAYTHGYIDGYFGPPGWVDAPERPLLELRDDAARLAESVTSLADASRRRFLEAQVRAMRTTIHLLLARDGTEEALSYEEEVRGLFDVEARAMPEAELDRALRELQDLLPGEGTLLERELAFRRRVEVRPSDLPRVASVIVRELRERTLRAFGLPDGESFDVELVTGKPWSGYNWPLGELRSRVELNTDLPVYLHDLPALLAHEGYPGHHTEHAWKEALLVHRAGYQEFSLLLINAPECVVSEGIAMRALSMIVSPEELREWLTGELASLVGVDAQDVLVLLRLAEVKKTLRYVSGNAALMLHAQDRAERDVLEYIQHYALRTPEQAAKSLQFIQQPNFRSYIFTYTAGEELLEPLLAGSDRVTVFRRLLTEPVTPGVLREWAARREHGEAAR